MQICDIILDTASEGVNYMFMFVDPPENVQLETSAADNKACEGETISFNCSADALPSVISYQLLENGSVVSDTSGMWSRTLSSGGVFIYKCVANNSLGSTESEYVTVTVNGKQIFLLTTEYCVKTYESIHCLHLYSYQLSKVTHGAVHVCRYSLMRGYP